MKILPIYIILISIAVYAFNQSIITSEPDKLAEKIKEIFINQPFDGVRIIEIYKTKYFLSASSVKIQRTDNLTDLTRIATMKAKNSMIKYLNGSQITSVEIVKIIDRNLANGEIQYITDSIELIKENSIGFIRGLETIISFLDNGKSTLIVILGSRLDGKPRVLYFDNIEDKPSNADSDFKSDIELDVPQRTSKNPKSIAIIIAIRDYASKDIPTVEYAKRDAAVMREYLVKVLGYDPKNILPQNPDELMTVGNMKSLLRQKLPSFVKPDGSSDIFVYYTGHGAPSTTSQQPFFVPYDCDPNFVSEDNAYRMTDFYADIAKVTAKKKTVVIDACFSGQAGDGKAIIKNASPVLFRVENPLLADKDVLIFQSSESSQVSNWYPEKKHGMFTYFFLKGLKGEADKNSDGSITAGELEEYINDENNNMPYVSRREYQRPQRAVVSGDKNSNMIRK